MKFAICAAVVSVCVVGCAVAGAAASGDWPQPRHDADLTAVPTSARKASSIAASCSTSISRLRARA